MGSEKTVEREIEIEKLDDKVEDEVVGNAHRKEDICSLDDSIWKDCSFLVDIDFTAVQAYNTPKPKCANQYTEHVVEEEIMYVEPHSQKSCFALNANFEDMNEGDAINEGEPVNPSSQHLQLTLSTNNPKTDPINDEFGKAESVDVTDVFTTDEVFPSKHALVDWCQSKGRGIQTIVVTAKSDQGRGNMKPRLYLTCERSGIYIDHRPQGNKSKKKRDSATRKCNCPFSIRGVNVGVNQWKVQIRCGLHNHELPKTLVGHPFAGRLSKEDKMFVAELSVAGVKPKDVLTGLKRRHEDNASTMKTIYNAKSKMRLHAMEGKSAMQQLLKVLVAKHYVYWNRSDETTDEVLDLFWAHPDCILLAKCFPSVVIVDCTYKTNKYKMHLFAMVGITSTAKTFSIAHCFLYKEIEDNYQWALSKLKLLFEPHHIPNVFITDREFAVINAIHRVFPSAHHMLCTLHISKNVEQHCKPLFTSTPVWTKFFDDWQAITKSTSEEEFFKRWEELHKHWLQFPKCIEYLTRAWFPHREAFVHAWTNRIKHRGNRTTNRAEGSHGKLKRHLDNGVGTFCSVFEGMDNYLSLQINEVKSVFERSLGSVKERHNGMLFKLLRGNLSHFALDMIQKEKDRSIDIGLDPSTCGHLARTVYGLSCAHELLQYSSENRPIPIESVDEHWTKLTILSNTEDKNELFHTAEYGLLKELYDQSTEDEKKVLLRKLKDLATSSTTSLREPTPVISKGRPRGSKNKMSQKEKKHEVSTKRDPLGFEYAKTIEEHLAATIPSQLSQVSKPMKEVLKKRKQVDRKKWELKAYMHCIPEFLHPYIANIEDVKGDGHCGYRCIAEHMGWYDDKGSWRRVRMDLLADLNRYKEKYDTAWGSWYFTDCQYALDFFEVECKTHNHWMVMPDMGFLIASAYNCVVILYSKEQSLTFFPHAQPPPKESVLRILPIAYVNKNHFVKLFLKDGAPFPCVATKWNTLRTDEATAWMQVFEDRIKLFKELACCGIRTKDSTIIIN